MDPDFALLCALREAPLDGPAVWARRAGMDASSARRRIKRLTEAGALRGFTSIPAAQCFGRVYRDHQFAAPDGVDEAAVLAVPDVAWFARSLDGNLYVITYEAEVDRRPELEALLGPNIGTFQHADSPSPTVLGRIELRVLREMILDPRASIAELVERTGLSSKTVCRHRAELVAKRLITVDPVLRTPTVPGRLFHHFAVEVDGLAHRQSVADRVAAGVEGGDAVLINHFDEPPVAYMFASSAGQVEQQQHMRNIAALPHVTDVRLLINQEYAVAVERMVDWCDEAIRAWSR